jgi:hypothetical protein
MPAMNDALPSITTYPQGSLLFPREPITFKVAGSRGRAFSAHPGQSFWVTTTEHAQKANGCVGIARSGKNAAHANFFSLADAAKYFRPIAQ